MIPKEELIYMIEEARILLNKCIDTDEDSDMIYEKSIELDNLIEQYIAAGY